MKNKLEIISLPETIKAFNLSPSVSLSAPHDFISHSGEKLAVPHPTECTVFGEPYLYELCFSEQLTIKFNIPLNTETRRENGFLVRKNIYDPTSFPNVLIENDLSKIAEVWSGMAKKELKECEEIYKQYDKSFIQEAISTPSPPAGVSVFDLPTDGKSISKLHDVGFIRMHLERTKHLKKLIKENDINLFADQYVHYGMTHKQQCPELFDLSNGRTIFSIRLFMVDKVLKALHEQDQIGSLEAYKALADFTGKTQNIFPKDPNLSVKSNHARDSNLKSQRRFQRAKDISRKFAESSWNEDPKLRVRQISETIHESFKKDLKDIGLKSTPTINTINKWIKDLAPHEDCFKRGRPKKK